ncbi:MAG: 6-bladed beta-propeller, partial [Bacteroidales bacterium]
MAIFLSLGNKRGLLSYKRIFALLLSFSLFFLSYSCSNKQVSPESDITVIDFVSGLNSPRIIELSEIATNIEYIPLETTDASLISAFPIVSIGNNRIYVVSGRKEVKIFDIKGNYLFTFDRRGRGPQEYIYPQGFYFDQESGDIIVNAFTQGSAERVFRVNRYDSLGSFLSSEQLVMIDSCFIDIPIKINENLYLGAVPAISRNKPDFWVVAFQKDGYLVKKIPAPAITQQQQEYLPKRVVVAPGLPGEPTPISNLTPSIYNLVNFTRIFSRYIDTLYSLDNNLRYKPEFIFNYGTIMADGTVPEGAKRGEGKYVMLDERDYQEW